MLSVKVVATVTSTSAVVVAVVVARALAGTSARPQRQRLRMKNEERVAERFRGKTNPPKLQKCDERVASCQTIYNHFVIKKKKKHCVCAVLDESLRVTTKNKQAVGGFFSPE